MRKHPVLTILLIVLFLGLLVEVIVTWEDDYNSLTTAEYRELLREGKERK